MLTFAPFHTGIREFARSKSASVTYIHPTPPDLRLDESTILRELDNRDSTVSNLFAYPAQSNFSGVQHPLSYIPIAQSKGWDVLLDCAAFAPTNKLSLREHKPDFVPLSFYKMFGYPTGAGCLIAKTEKLEKLRRPWFAGGTITIASAHNETWVG